MVNFKSDRTKVRSENVSTKLTHLENVRLYDLACASRLSKSKLLLETLKYIYNFGNEGTETEKIMAERFIKFLAEKAEGKKLNLEKMIEFKKDFISMYGETNLKKSITGVNEESNEIKENHNPFPSEVLALLHEYKRLRNEHERALIDKKIFELVEAIQKLLKI